MAIAVGGGIFLRFDEAHDVVHKCRRGIHPPPAWIVLLAISRAYERERINLGTEQFKSIFEASVRMAALTAFFVYITKSEVSRGFFLLALPGGLRWSQGVWPAVACSTGLFDGGAASIGCSPWARPGTSSN